METLTTYKKAFAIWRPFTKWQSKARINGELIKNNSFAYCINRVTLEAKAAAGKEALITRWKELALNEPPVVAVAEPTMLENFISGIKKLYDQIQTRFEFGDPNRIHPIWGRKITRWEYLWMGLKSLPFERQDKIIPCRSHLIGKPAMSDYAIAGYSDLSKTDPFGKETYAPERTDAKPNVEEWLSKNSVLEDSEYKQPNTEWASQQKFAF